MKEKVKSVILLLLTANALILSLSMWKGDNDSYSEEVHSGTSFFDVLKPERTLMGTGSYIMLSYGDFNPSLYDASYEVLKDAFNNEHLIQSLKPSGKYVEFDFFPINTYILAEAFGVHKSTLNQKVDKIKSIRIYLDNNILFFEGNNGTIAVKYDASKGYKLLSAFKSLENNKNLDYYYNAKENLSTLEDIYFPYEEMKKTMPNLSLENEIRDMKYTEKRELAEKFLSKGSGTLQEITREDGTTLYLSGNEVLTLASSGELTYFSPLSGKIRNSNVVESLNYAVMFLKSGANLRNFYLSQINEINTDGNTGYEIFFDYKINGIPVLYRNSHAIRVEVYRNHIRSVNWIMRRENRKLISEENELNSIISSLDILQNEYDIFAKIYSENKKKKSPEVHEVLDTIDNITLCYYDGMFKEKDSTIIPVWLFKTEFGNLGFNAVNGNMVLKDLRN